MNLHLRNPIDAGPVPELREAGLRSRPACPFCRARLEERSAEALAPGTPFRPGETVEGLRILKLLGQGGFGKVFLAQSPTHGICAVKTLRDELLPRDHPGRERILAARAVDPLRPWPGLTALTRSSIIQQNI